MKNVCHHVRVVNIGRTKMSWACTIVNFSKIFKSFAQHENPGWNNQFGMSTQSQTLLGVE